MNGKEATWNIWIDTGGTFTDCIAFDPHHQIRRIKVLSSSALRGRILRTTGKYSLHIESHWNVQKDIFEGYHFKVLGKEHETITVESYDSERQQLVLSKLPPLDKLPEQGFEITANEEAPVLAARIATETALHENLPQIEMRLGSTRGTNALLEHKGARTALILSKGLKDLLAIDTQQRPDIFALNIIKPKPYYHTVLEVDERLDAKGKVIKPLSEHVIEKLIQQLKESKIETVAIALMHSYLNNTHEQKLAQCIVKAGFKYVSASASLAPAIKILSRAKTALVNAYLSPAVNDYLDAVKNKLGDSKLQVMTSAGGLVGAALFQPKDSLLSGPAGGVVGAAHICKLSQQFDPEIKKVLAFDMGGTSTDVSRYDGEYDYRYETQVGDINLFSPSLAIETVAAGGGSCCSFDGHKLTVGPESAGARPGPACYGFGGPLTITDVNLLLGRLSESHFGIPISKAKAQKALDELKSQISEEKGHSYSDEEILTGFLSIANEKMTDTIHKISVRKGYDPQQYALLACGGAGGQHACQIAEMLGIEKILLPYDAGLLSAYGMGQALVERFATRQLLQPLTNAQNHLEEVCHNLADEALQLLQKEGYNPDSLEIRFVKLYLRFQGQESSLEIDYTPSTDIRQAFKDKYQALYGHWLEEQSIEIESIKAVASTKAEINYTSENKLTQVKAIPVAQHLLWTSDHWKEVGVYRWESLDAGAFIEGPALLVSENCTTLIEKNWRLQLDSYYNAVLSKLSNSTTNRLEQPEEVKLELFTNRFSAIADEMGALLERTSFSVNVKERLDFSCALLDPEGELIVNAPHIPVHLGSLGICVRSVREIVEMQEGDVIITNHPAYGGSHLPDITLISPVYKDHQLVGYVANRAHHAELGGSRPGSMPPDANNLAEEGVVIPPTHLAKQGIVQWDAIKQLLTAGQYPSRSVEENLADLRGALASIHSGVSALQRLCDLNSVSEVLHYMKAIKAYAHNCILQSIHSLEDKIYKAEEFLDDGSPIKVSITINKGKVDIDFEGSGATHPANLNANLAIVNSAVIYVLRLLVRQAIPLNEGLMQSVDLHVPKGSFLNPVFSDVAEDCPAVVGGNTETSQRVVDTLLKALGIAACSQGTMNNLLFGNQNFGYYETIGGGSGAGNGFCGADAVHQHMTNTRITDPEIFEFRYPVRLEEFSIRKNSGGKGQWKGGNGIIRKIKFLDKVSLTILSQHRKEQPYGIKGGGKGESGKQYIVKENGEQLMLKGNDQIELLAGDQVCIETPGGGAYGANT